MAYSQPDNTYFVESDEPQHRISARDAAKMIARNRQELIAAELSRLAADEYLEDIMQHMANMEAGREAIPKDLGLTLCRMRLSQTPT